MTLDIANPVPGFYPSIPEADYHRIQAASSHRLTPLLRSPAHARNEWSKPWKPSPEFVFGRAVHLEVLEPHRLETEYVKGGFCDAILKTGSNKGSKCTNPGKRLYADQWWCDVHSRDLPAGSDPRTVLSPADWLRMKDCAAAIREHPQVAKLLNEPVLTEVSSIWIDEASGALCKCRTDAVSEAYAVALDIKTSQDASEDEFTRSMYKYGYHRQSVHNLAGLAAQCPFPVDRFLIIAAESEPYHGVMTYQVHDRALEAGAKQLVELLHQYADVEAKRAEWDRSGKWPGYSTDVKYIDIPDWSANRILK